MKNPYQTPIMYLKGVGEHRARLLKKLNIETVEDLMTCLPRAYINRHIASPIASMEIGEWATVIAEVAVIEKRVTGRQQSQLQVYLDDGSDQMVCTWFRYGPWLLKDLKQGQKVWVNGIVSEFKGQMQMVHPEIEILDAEEEKDSFWREREILPVYSLTQGFSIKQMRNLVKSAFELYQSELEETLPASLLDQYHWQHRNQMLWGLHFPNSVDAVEGLRARFAFEEFFYSQILWARSQHSRKSSPTGIVYQLQRTYTTNLKNSLPFQMTTAQKKVIREIVQDMTSSKQMNRLLQGDVGSGKTIVTVFAMLLAIENGYQAVLLAPTEILAEQHFKNIVRLLDKQESLHVVYLKGGQYKGKSENKALIESGSANLIIGTHALLQPDIKFARLGLVVIDEQHRFGVEQRAILSQRDIVPDMLYLSATPIPRSLAMTIYGDLDVSVLDELPPNRKPIKTVWVINSQKRQVYSEIKKELSAGRQCYVVCPLIEESEKSDLLDAETLYKQITTQVYPEYKVSLLHGKMKSAEKEAVMREFQTGVTQLLVSTTVIEVGVDVPNASVMMIEHAERFGLSQLHQLRGRVGRGANLSYCYLISYPQLSRIGRERLVTMCQTTDGFEIAEKDLELRGPGEFFGTEQSGMPQFKYASLVKDQIILQEARTAAFRMIEEDPELNRAENRLVKHIFNERYRRREMLIDY